MNGATDSKHLSLLTCVCVRKREKLPCDLFLKVYLSLSISVCILSLNVAGKSLSPSNRSSHFSFTLVHSVLWRAFTHASEQLGTHQGTYDSMNFVTRSRRWKTGDDFSVAAVCSPDFFFFPFILVINLSALIVGERVRFRQNLPPVGNILWPVGDSLLWGPQLLSGKGLRFCQILPPAPQVK